MNYKHKRSQIFAKKLNVPKEVKIKIYNCDLSLKDFIYYDLIGKVPFSCLSFSDIDVAYKIGEEGLKKLKATDLNLMEKYLKDIEKSLMQYHTMPKNIVELVNQTIISKSDREEKRIFLKSMLKNNFQMNDQNIETFINDYGTILDILFSNSKILNNFDTKSIIENIIEKKDNPEKIKEYLKKFTDEILDNTYSEYKKNYDEEYLLSNNEYKEIFKFSSIEDYFKKISCNLLTERFVNELHEISEDYLFAMPIPFKELLNENVRYFIGLYGLKNIVNFDNECGHFFTKDNCKMLKSIHDIYLRNDINILDPNMTLNVKKNIDEKGNRVDRPYTKDEFYEVMRRMIIYGPRNWDYHGQHPDYREITGEFKTRNPELFISEEAPEELQNLFYQKNISPEIIQSHPEWKQFFQGKEIDFVCDANIRAFVRKCKQLGFDNNNVFELFDKYGSYIVSCQINIDNINSNNLRELDNIIRQQMIKAITVKGLKYDEGAKAIIGQDHPELFLDENAPDELKEVFYNYTFNTPLTFELLRQHREWLPYLEGKNVLLSLKKRNIGIGGLEQLFEKYGEQEALRIGMKNPESVMQMLSENKFDILSDWYDKLHFIPHHTVMKEFPFEQVDKFVASGKKWSQLMRIERHNINDDSKAALLKASMCFGVFDNDMDGFNKIKQLFSDIPKSLSTQDMQGMLDFIQKQISSLGDNPDPKMIEEYNKQLALIQQCYGQNKDGAYSLKINSQQNKNIVQTLRSIMEDSNVSTILTTDKSHKLFGAFVMNYDPDFRDFILKNMDTILSSDEYISYISSMQKQWSEIRANNSNLVLTLDLALAYVKSNKYTNVQTGNIILAEKVSERGYNQEDFERLQQIYNYAKMRVFSTIPRVHFETDEYICEIIRLDDPIALVIGKLTNCCQELGNAAESCMTHSAVDKTGRLFYIKDKEGRPIAQSWVWRNQNVLCFDNIEIPEKAFTNAARNRISREQFADTIYALYQRAAQELMEKDKVEFKKLLEEGKITEKKYEALKLEKVTVGTGYNDIKEALKRTAIKDSGRLVDPLPYTSPINGSHYLYNSDHLEGQYIVAGKRDVIASDYEVPAIYSDEFIIHDNSNSNKLDALMLQKLELATRGDSYSRITQSDETDKIVSNIAYNYGLNPETTKIIMNANFAIIYDMTNEEIIVGDILYNTSFNNQGQQVDITDKVAMQIRMAIEQIGVKGKKFNISHLSEEQLKMCNKAMNLEAEIDEERGLSHGAR